MTHRHRKRRGVAPRPSNKDLRALRRLVERSARLGADPMIEARPVVVAAEKAGKAILPVGHQRLDSEFVLLRNLVLPFPTLNAVDRMAAGPEIARLSAVCLEVLNRPVEGGRERKDIDG